MKLLRITTFVAIGIALVASVAAAVLLFSKTTSTPTVDLSPQYMKDVFIAISTGVVSGVFGLVLKLLEWRQQERRRRSEEGYRQQEREREDRLHEEERKKSIAMSYSDYLESMKGLLLEGSADAAPSETMAEVARAKTLAVLQSLDGQHKRLLLSFLHENRLIILPDTDGEKAIADRHSAPGVLPPFTLSLRHADLKGASLENLRLPGVNFRGVDLSGADLRGAKVNRSVLYKANLRGADIRRALLGGSDLRGADLTDADLTEARLGGVDLSRASLVEAKLVGAKLKNANMFRANLSMANLSGADLRLARGLTQEQLESSIGNAETKLPKWLLHPNSWNVS